MKIFRGRHNSTEQWTKLTLGFRLKNILPQSQLSIVYYALVESHLRYGDVVWGSLSKAKLAALQRLQTRALKIIRNAKIRDTWSCPGMNVS